MIRVKCEQLMSDPIDITKGVYQGTVLRPFYLIYL